MAIEAISDTFLLFGFRPRLRLFTFLVRNLLELFISLFNLSVSLKEGLHYSLCHVESLTQIFLRQVVQIALQASLIADELSPVTEAIGGSRCLFLEFKSRRHCLIAARLCATRCADLERWSWVSGSCIWCVCSLCLVDRESIGERTSLLHFGIVINLLLEEVDFRVLKLKKGPLCWVFSLLTLITSWFSSSTESSESVIDGRGWWFVSITATHVISMIEVFPPLWAYQSVLVLERFLCACVLVGLPWVTASDSALVSSGVVALLQDFLLWWRELLFCHVSLLFMAVGGLVSGGVCCLVRLTDREHTFWSLTLGEVLHHVISLLVAKYLAHDFGLVLVIEWDSFTFATT